MEKESLKVVCCGNRLRVEEGRKIEVNGASGETLEVVIRVCRLECRSCGGTRKSVRSKESGFTAGIAAQVADLLKFEKPAPSRVERLSPTWVADFDTLIHLIGVEDFPLLFTYDCSLKDLLECLRANDINHEMLDIKVAPNEAPYPITAGKSRFLISRIKAPVGK